MDKEKLLQLATHLETIDPYYWDFNYFVRFVEGGTGVCGCALGHSVDLWPDVFKIVHVPYVGKDLSIAGCNNTLDQIYANAAKFFDIGYGEARWLFLDPIDQFENVTTKFIADRIREFCGLY